MKLIFLDVDGVLNSGDGNNAIGELILEGFIPSHCDQRWFQPRHVRLLYKIEHLTGAHLVLSSSWRNGNSLDYVQSLMREAGHPRPTLIGKTDSEGPTRGAEIARYLKRYNNDPVLDNVSTYVVLDDDWDKDLDLDLDHFVQIDYREGLTERHVQRAVEILNK